MVGVGGPVGQPKGGMDMEYPVGAGTSPGRLLILVDGYRQGSLTGRACPWWETREVPFSQLCQLLLMLDGWMDRMGYPQGAVERRSFCGDTAEAPRVDRPRPGSRRTVPGGNLATFIVQVQYRQNATWQGHVTWAERDRTQAFRSALELLKLLDGALRASLADGPEGQP